MKGLVLSERPATPSVTPWINMPHVFGADDAVHSHDFPWAGLKPFDERLRTARGGCVADNQSWSRTLFRLGAGERISAFVFREFCTEL